MTVFDDELTPEQKFAAENPEKWVPGDLAKGRDREDILAELLRLDWTPKAAEALIERAADLERYRASPEERHRLVREAFRQMIGGLVLGVIGFAFGVSTLLFAL